MILSSVNFVKSKNISNNGISSQQFADFILGKIKEDETNRKQEDSSPFSAVIVPKKTRNVFNFDNIPTPKKRISVDREIIKSSNSDESDAGIRPYITIQTSDGYYLSADTESRRFFLEDTAFPTHQTCTFQIMMLKSLENKQSHVAFKSMAHGGHHYLTVDADKKLSLQEFDCEPCLDTEDERVFVKYEVDTVNVLLQPLDHKGYYLHHIDKNIDVLPLEINWRPPEEFFFELSENELFQNEIIDTFQSPAVVMDDFLENNFTLSRQKRNVIHQIPKVQPAAEKACKPSLLFGCFGIRSKKPFPATKTAQKKTKSKR